MKKLLSIITISVFLISCESKLILTKISELPNTKDFMTENGEHVDIAYGYERHTFMFLPAWNSNVTFYSVVPKPNNGTKYDYQGEWWEERGKIEITKYRYATKYKSSMQFTEISKDNLAILKSKLNIDIPEDFNISFYEKIGGKLILMLMLLLCLGLRIVLPKQ
jgi:hypothetical protein